MEKILIIIFRECTEISVLLGMVLAATKNIYGSRLCVIIGSTLGGILSIIFAFAAYNLKELFYFVQEDVVEAFIVLFTSFFIIWTVSWIGSNPFGIKNGFSSISNKIVLNRTKKNNNKMNYLLLILLIAFILFREGTEIILFIYGITMSQSISVLDNILPIILGGGCGFLLGFSIYFGLLKFPVKYIFKFSSIFLILISAGLASESASILTTSGLINVLNQELWNTSWFIDTSTIFGKTFSVLTGYTARPNGLQILFYISAILISIIAISTRKKIFFKLKKNKHTSKLTG